MWIILRWRDGRGSPSNAPTQPLWTGKMMVLVSNRCNYDWHRGMTVTLARADYRASCYAIVCSHHTDSRSEFQWPCHPPISRQEFQKIYQQADAAVISLIPSFFNVIAVWICLCVSKTIEPVACLPRSGLPSLPHTPSAAWRAHTCKHNYNCLSMGCQLAGRQASQPSIRPLKSLDSPQLLHATSYVLDAPWQPVVVIMKEKLEILAE